MSKEDLRDALQTQHGGSARLAYVDHVLERFDGAPVWDGLVYVFDLDGHPRATRAYAWSSPVEGSDKRQFHAVLGVSPIQSAQDAVRAAIVADNGAR